MKISFKTRLQRNGKLLKTKEQPAFLMKLAVLLDEGYSLADSFNMLVPHHFNKEDDIESKVHFYLSEGMSLSELLSFLGVNDQYIMSVYVAEQNGTTVQALNMIVQKMNSSLNNKEQLIKLLSYPLFLFVFLIGLFVVFRTYFLPNMSAMMHTRDEKQSIQLFISKILLHLPDFLIAITIAFALISLGIFHYLRKKDTGKQLLLYYKIPLIGRVLQIQLTKLVAFEIGSLLEGAFTIQSTLHILANQPHQKLVAYNAKLLHEEIAQGESLAGAVLINPYLHKEFYSYVAHGEKSGKLGKELLLLSEFMNEKMNNRVEKYLKIMQPVLFCIIAICILGAYISIMLPMYEMIELI